jgi:S-methylmethionine-dependent homocysteine/selenocysteine methylase
MMLENIDGRNAILRGIHVLDGGLASELEYLGAQIDTPLWSAQVLEVELERVTAGLI